MKYESGKKENKKELAVINKENNEKTIINLIWGSSDVFYDRSNNLL
jgi:hypothetical protein